MIAIFMMRLDLFNYSLCAKVVLHEANNCSQCNVFHNNRILLTNIGFVSFSVMLLFWTDYYGTLGIGSKYLLRVVEPMHNFANDLLLRDTF